MSLASLINKNTGRSQGMRFLALLIAGGTIYGTYDLVRRGIDYFDHKNQIETIDEALKNSTASQAVKLIEEYKKKGILKGVWYQRFNSEVVVRISQKNLKSIEGFIAEGNIRDAERFLSLYAADRTITKVDVARLRKKIDLKQSEAEKIVLDERLNISVGNFNYHKASKILAKIRTSKLFSEKELTDYQKKVQGVSLDMLVKKAGLTSGRDQLRVISSVEKHHPNYEGLPQLKEQKLRTYMGLSESYFATQNHTNTVLAFLKEFHTWLKENPGVARKGNFTDFVSKGDVYMAQLAVKKAGKKGNEYELGDVIVITQNLGGMARGKNNEYFIESWSVNTKKIPIGSTAMIVGYNTLKTQYQVRVKSKREYRLSLIPAEFKLDSANNTAVLHYEFSMIKKYVQQVRRTK